jgi:hypothetical protein
MGLCIEKGALLTAERLRSYQSLTITVSLFFCILSTIFYNFFRNSSAFGFLLQASSHAKPLRGGLMHLCHYAVSRTLQ